MSWRFAPYVSVAKRRETAGRKMEKLRKQGIKIQSVEIEGRKIARTFWGESWCDHLESFSVYANRLPRGRTYVRNGSVCHLEIVGGKVKAIVSGSELYDVQIEIKQLPADSWEKMRARCSGKIGSLLELLQGKLSTSVMTVVTDRKEGLFPQPSEIELDCSCPDWASMCKHVAAVLYGIGARLDHQPELLFVLRGVDHEELIIADAAAAASVIGGKRAGRSIADGDLADIFGIEMLAEQSSNKGALPAKPEREESRKVASTKKSSGAKQQEQSVTSKVEPTPTAKTVRELRAKLEMSQSELAALIGVTPGSVSLWEKKEGLLNLQPRTLSALAAAGKLTKKQAWVRLATR